MEKLKQRSNIVLLLFMLIALMLIVLAAILTIATDKRLEANLVVMNRSPQSFLALGKKIEELQQITKEIDNYTLGQIKNTLTTEKPSIFENTLNFVISFVLGVLSSIVASGFYESWKEKRIRRLKS